MASALDLLKKHDSNGLMNTGTLQFFYPFIISSDLDKKYSGVLRQFMMTQYLAQMKISNALHVTTNLVNSASRNRDQNNPAERLNNNITDNNPQNYDAPDIDKFEAQQQIDKFREMLVHLVKNEPRYAELNPIVSTLTMENLLTIPIIVGSKKFTASADVLYWMLFAAAGQRIRLDSVSGLKSAENVLRHIPPENFEALLDPALQKRAEDMKRNEDRQHAKLVSTPGVHRYFQSLNDKLSKVVNTISMALNEDKWNNEVGINSSYDTSLSAASISTMGANQTIITNSNALFASLTSNYVMHLFQSLLNSIVTTEEIDVVRLVSDAALDIVKNQKIVADQVLLGIMGRLQANTVSSSDVLFSKLEQSCKANSKIDVSNILNNLGTLDFSIAGSGFDLAAFAENMVRVSSELAPLSQMIDGFIDDAASGFGENETGANRSTGGILAEYKKQVNARILKVFHDKDIQSAIDGEIKSARFRFLVGRTTATATKFIETMSSALTEILYFLSMYTFYSYFCEYTGELAAEVEVKRRDVMDFPNYCLVVPAEALNAIYAALSARNFKEMVTNPDHVKTDFQRISTQNLNNVITVLGNNLGIRNIIVVDEKAKQIYYKWMYSKQPQRIGIATLSSYIKTQSEFIKAY